jgi:hypothetical protein
MKKHRKLLKTLLRKLETQRAEKGSVQPETAMDAEQAGVSSAQETIP